MVVDDELSEACLSPLFADIQPQILQVLPNVFGARFQLMKLLPAWYMISQARKTGELQPGAGVIESSSGTFALALALTCRHFGHPLELVTGGLNQSLCWRLTNLGARVSQVTDADGPGGIQQARLDLLAGKLDADPRLYWPRQYTNKNNPAAYKFLGQRFAASIGKIDCLVGTVGSGGSLCGTARYLRQANPDLQVIAVDSPMSVLFGSNEDLADDLCRVHYNDLLGMGASIVIPNVDHGLCNEVHWVPLRQMTKAVYDLHASTGLLMGPTSGAAYLVARWWAQKHPAHKVAVILPDSGVRYMDTIYATDWMAKWSIDSCRLQDEPVEIANPVLASAEWSRMIWGRRTLQEIQSRNLQAVEG